MGRSREMRGGGLASRWLKGAVVGVLIAAIFVADLFTDWAVAAAVLYIVPVLLSLRLFSTRHVLWLSAACVVLTVVGGLLAPFGSAEAGFVNIAIGIAAIVTTAYLGLRILWLEAASHEARVHLLRLSRIGNLGELAASIAHEVNQPLAALSSSAGAGRRWLDATPPDVARAREALERIGRDATRAAEVIAGVRRLASGKAAAPEWTSMADVLDECVAIARAELDRHDIGLAVERDEALPALRMDRTQIQQVVVNLLLNAIESLAQAARADREIRIVVRRDADHVSLCVADNGPGLSAEAERHLWEPFWTGKAGGIGLGLTMSREIAESHGGSLRCRRPAGGGAAFDLRLPLKGAE